jgi:hypothetical protein
MEKAKTMVFWGCWLSLLLWGGLLPGELAGQAPPVSDTTYRLLFQEEGPVRFFTTDALQQLYFVNEKEEVLKYDANFRLQFTYPNTTLGRLHVIDVVNPFHLLLFYADQQTILLLDRTLGDQARLDLRTTDLQNVTAAALSLDNNIWVYDDYAFQLFLLNPQGEVLLTSDDLRLTENITGPATQLLRWREYVLVNFPDRGIAVFTNFGRLQHWLPYRGVQCWQAWGSYVLLQKDGRHLTVDPLTGKTLPNRAPILQPGGCFQARQDRWYWLSPAGQLSVWEWTSP